MAYEVAASAPEIEIGQAADRPDDGEVVAAHEL